MTKTWIGAAIVALGLAAPVSAQSHAGVRAGVSGDPGQFVFGGHVETRPLIEHVTFRPNLEVGLGDGLTTVCINLEFAYWIPERRHPWAIYLGAGPAAVVHGGPSHVGGGFNVLVGLQHREGLFVELKVGMMESPGLKFMIGYEFR